MYSNSSISVVYSTFNLALLVVLNLMSCKLNSLNEHSNLTFVVKLVFLIKLLAFKEVIFFCG